MKTGLRRLTATSVAPDKIAIWLAIPSVILVLPIVVVFYSLSIVQVDVWQHLAQTVLSDYVFNSIILATGVGVGVLLVGTSLAWCIARYEFPGRNILQWLLILPLAMPAYIIAYSYTGLLDFAGPLQSTLRTSFGWQYGDYYFPEIRSLGGAIFVMTMVLYPYVYLLARTAFSDQSIQFREASVSLGVGHFGFFRKIAFPLAKPAIFMGTALAMMEALADYGTVQYFGVSTFTTGIFRTWFGMGNQIAASQLAALLCTFVLVLLLLEKWSRRKIKYYQKAPKNSGNARIFLGRWQGLGMFALCLLVPLLGFFVPVYQLGLWALSDTVTSLNSDFFSLVGNSFLLASGAAFVTVLVAAIFVYAKRLSGNSWVSSQNMMVSLGYAIPGAVVAVGVMIPLSFLDHKINALTLFLFDTQPGLILSGSLFALIMAYCVRFLSVAMQNIDTGLQRVTPSMDNAARSLGRGPLNVFREIHLPIIKGSALSAMLLVFVDVLKELPATLILRPFNFDTLAVSAYQYASDERLNDAAFPALAIVLTGLIPVILLSKAMDKKRTNYARD